MRLRGRFTVWFLLAALVPIAVAALVTREEVSRSYREDYSRLRAGAEQTALHELGRIEDLVGDSVEALASRKHDFVGSFLFKLEKSQGVITRDISRWLKERAGPQMRGLGLDLLFLVDATDQVIVAPHYRDARGNIDATHRERARTLAGKSFYTREPTIQGDKIRQMLVVESVRRVGAGASQVTVVGGLEIGAGLLAVVRSPGNIDARIVDPAGTVLVASVGEWDEAAENPSIRLPLAGADGATVAWIEVATSDADLRKLLGKVTVAALVLAGAAMLVTMMLAFLVARRMTHDLDKLVAGAQAASRGDLDHRVEVKTTDEIGALADSFNAMMADLKSSKERLVIAERIAAWQEIARRLAHEIKNPLTPIQMSVETMRKTWRQKHPSFEESFEESTATVLEETARLKRIVTEFSEFARMPKPQTGPCNLNELVASTVALYEGAVAISRELDQELPEIEADRDQLAQVILNLIENARDAISLRAAGSPGARIVVTTRRVGPAVVLVVEDNGPGIAPEVKKRLFTPYFTTKQSKGGTGLGLATVHRVVSDHSGKITIEDAPTGGARFIVELPIAQNG